MVEKRTVYIRFHAAINFNTINTLTTTIQKKFDDGYEKFVLLISSVGGSVFHGVHAYNFLKGIPAEVITHNVGSSNSVAVVLFCAGSERFCSPNARFLIHSLTTNLQGDFELKQIEEQLNILRNETETMAKIISDTTQKTTEEVMKIMAERTAFNAEQSKEIGLTTKIKTEIFEKGAEVIEISEEQ